MIKFANFVGAILEAERRLLTESEEVHTHRWQGIDISAKREAAMHEVLYYGFDVPIQTENLTVLADLIQPNLPWADDHFEERVCGEPLNPGVQWAKWPYGNSADKFREENGQFNHNYMERYWPRFANLAAGGHLDGDENRWDIDFGEWPDGRQGIRYRYGDLNDLVEQLYLEPDTRQAYLPIFFPEDTGVANPSRKPCTLGYLFMMRNNRLDVTYYIRSCDFKRHFRDDIYMTVRLLLWVLDRLRERDNNWEGVKPGRFRMDIGSLHLFRNDYLELKNA